MNAESQATQPSKRLRFSVAQMLGFILITALLISNVLLVLRIRDAERELAQLRREQGKLVVDDPDQMNVIEVP